MLHEKKVDDSHGIESEGWVFEWVDGKLVPVPVESISAKLACLDGVSLKGKIYRESGEGAIEFASDPADTLEKTAEYVHDFMRRAKKLGIEIMFSCKSPFDVSSAQTLVTQKSRFKAIVEASKIETGHYKDGNNSWKALLEQNQYAATHLSRAYKGRRVDGEIIDHGLLGAKNVIDNYGAVIAKIICKKFGVDNTRHIAIFTRWAAIARFSSYGMWSRDTTHFKRQLSEMTRFIKLVSGDKENGEWEPDLKTRLNWEEDEDSMLLGVWHLCRPRKKYGTIETRVLPSLPHGILLPALRDLDDFVTFLVNVIEPQDLQVTGPDDFMSRPVWREICRYKIGNSASLPLRYSLKTWLGDVYS